MSGRIGSIRAEVGKIGTGGAQAMVGRRGRHNATTRAKSLACDAGYLGLVDLVLATDASAFVAVDVKQPWKSAFLEWIVQARRLAGRAAKTELISC